MYREWTDNGPTMHRHWTDNASTLDRQSPEKDRFAQSRKSKVESRKNVRPMDSKTSYLLVKNYPKLKKIIHSQITQIKQINC